MLNDLQAPIEQEEETEERRLEDEMPMNVGVDIDKDRTNIFHDLLNEARNELYPGYSEFSSLNLLVKLMNVKVLNGWSNKSFDMLLELLRALFPMCSTTVPSLFYEAKRKLRDMGLGYETIHACKYDCVLYWKEFTDLQHCPTCGEDRDKCVETDDVLRYLADAEGWKHFDSEYPDFASDPRNVHLGLIEFNPFGQMSLIHWACRLVQSANLSDDFFSLAMGPAFDIRCYNGCIVSGLRFHTSELDSRRTTQNSRVMVIGESVASGNDDNNFYGVLNKVLHEPVMFATQAHQVFYIDDPKNGINWKVMHIVQNKRIWDVQEVDDGKNDHINVLEIVVSHRVDDHIKDDTLCRTDVYLTIVERPVVRHVTDNFIDDVDEHLSHTSIMSYQRNNFLETDAMFLEFEDYLDNRMGGSSSVSDNVARSSSQPLTTPTPRRRTQSRLLKLERHVAINGRTPMTITLGTKKPISLHVIRFTQAIGVCVRKTFSVRCLKWANVGREYIEVVKGDFQQFFVLDFNDQNQMLELQSQPTLEGSQPLSGDMRYAIGCWVDDQQGPPYDPYLCATFGCKRRNITSGIGCKRHVGDSSSDTCPTLAKETLGHVIPDAMACVSIRDIMRGIPDALLVMRWEFFSRRVSQRSKRRRNIVFQRFFASFDIVVHRKSPVSCSDVTFLKLEYWKKACIFKRTLIFEGGHLQESGSLLTLRRILSRSSGTKLMGSIT
ncbi:CACTA en-spm transposon protein [Cucumis melo var. makuwa]|uniref:CACTA en-spm transposon protein n=1 Tax=Cucumis melo var. makuwa TaxID=1194695 RepID=A0A5A7SNK0_CUCMM|nr:CACTA en-spm transposon protein [Cucumis melo var. makuwa]TYK21473.1 CACTA en-spm transposon protein [Cucumis melo var. makuwa]